MSKAQSHAQFIFNHEKNFYECQGSWSVLCLKDLLTSFKPTPTKHSVSISGKKLTGFDSAGALALLHCIQKLKKLHKNVELMDFSAQQTKLLSLIEDKQDALSFSPPAIKLKSILYRFGKQVVAKINQAIGLINLVGDLCDKLLRAFRQTYRFHLPSIISNIYATGITALPILALLSFLIGVVLAYQMGLQLETYGASFFIAYLSGMAIFREFAPLITAIIVAGRTSSSFTAQIGSMKINEEIDALYTMGLSPTELLVTPKVLALFSIFPLLIFWSDVFSTLGAMLMSKFMLHVGYREFLTRIQEAVGFKQMMLGLYKAPTFALLIALVGCFQGFRVSASANSVGAQTTKSVVQALFLIIIADAIYSVIYRWMDL